MAGHSKWANIQHRKGAQDAKRGKLFTRLIRALKITARQGGPSPESNAALRNAIDAARAANMSKDVIERAIKSAVGDNDAVLEEIHYEGYGPGGVAVLVECMTDNKNRTVSEVRHLFTKYDGNLGANGSVSYLFSHQGVISFASGFDEERLMELALEAGAEDIRNNTDGSIDIITTVETFTHVKEFLENEQLSPSYAIVGMIPGTYVPVVNEDAENLMKMLEKLEELDDVQQVYTNADFPDDF